MPAPNAWATRDRRPPAVSGSFYPAEAERLRALVDSQLARAGRRPVDGTIAGGTPPGGSDGGTPPGGSAGGTPSGGSVPGRSPAGRAERSTARLVGLLVPHAGLVYSGLVAASAWSSLPRDPAPTIVILGTNHSAPWLRGIGVWDSGTWATPLGDVAIDDELAAAILGLGTPFHRDHEAHLGEHSIEVQLPFLQRAAPASRFVPLAVATGTASSARRAGAALGSLLADRARTAPVVLVASSDAAHYPSATDAEAVNARLLEPLEAVDAEALAEVEAAVVTEGHPGLVCGMCGIEPTVVGVAAFRSMGAVRGELLRAATSADAGGDIERTVGYLAVAFTA
jgi:AmmeMemoRadiSam system protein B